MIIGSKLPARIAANYGATSPQAQQTGIQGRREGQGRNDRVSLSSESRELYQLAGKLRDLPDVREERVAYLKGLVETGSYSANTAALAERLIENGAL